MRSSRTPTAPVRDLRLWAQLGLAADHADFIGFIRGYAVAHPSTKVTTELLFLIDTLAQANADALAVLVETTEPGDLEWTKETHPRAFLLAREIQRIYSRDIVRLGLTTRPAIDAFYGRGRLSVLSRILQTTPRGYRADDARFLMGEILWNQGDTDEALRMWRAMSAGPSDATYAIVIGQLRAAVQPAQPDARNIRYILRNQQGRWFSFSDDRLRRFGYRADAYCARCQFNQRPTPNAQSPIVVVIADDRLDEPVRRGGGITDSRPRTDCQMT
jgi:hypothetical protein